MHRLRRLPLRAFACLGFALHVGCGTATAPPSAADGRALYATNGCASCHGAAGRGNGPIAATLIPPPRDFRDAAAFKNGTDVPAIARTLAEGLTRDGGRMPTFDHLSSTERESLALFVMSLRDAATERNVQP